jgi:hypothetical protein
LPTAGEIADGLQPSIFWSGGLRRRRQAIAGSTWSQDDVLTLGLDTPWLWTDPLGEESLSVHIHECAHHEAGRDGGKELAAGIGPAVGCAAGDEQRTRGDQRHELVGVDREVVPVPAVLEEVASEVWPAWPLKVPAVVLTWSSQQVYGPPLSDIHPGAVPLAAGDRRPFHVPFGCESMI